MAPCKVSALSATRAPAAVTCAFTAAACSADCGPPPSTDAAAKYTADRAASTSTRIVAAACLTAWNEPIGTPNWWRCLLYSTARSSIRAIAPKESAATRTAARAAQPARNSRASTSSGSDGAPSITTSATDRLRSSSRRVSARTPALADARRRHGEPPWPSTTATNRAARSPASTRGGQQLGREGQLDQPAALTAEGFRHADPGPSVADQPPGELRRVTVIEPP